MHISHLQYVPVLTERMTCELNKESQSQLSRFKFHLQLTKHCGQIEGW